MTEPTTRPGPNPHASRAEKFDVVPATAQLAVSDAALAARHFDAVYREASGQRERIPWHHDRANPAMVEWLNTDAPGLIRPGAAVAVVACGLGSDVAHLAERGYEVVGFDVSPTAIDWAKGLHPELSDRLVCADLLELPARLRRRFDLVVEIHTIQALHPSLREPAIAGVSGLARPRGVVLVICHARAETMPIERVEGPPYPLNRPELLGLMESQGFHPMREIDDFVDDGPAARRRFRGMFRREPA